MKDNMNPPFLVTTSMLGKAAKRAPGSLQKTVKETETDLGSKMNANSCIAVPTLIPLYSIVPCLSDQAWLYCAWLLHAHCRQIGSRIEAFVCV